MAKIKGAASVDAERCKGCGVCIVACPTQVLALKREVNSKGYHYAYMERPENCTGCACCAVVCPDCCITVYRARKTAEARTPSAG